MPERNDRENALAAAALKLTENLRREMHARVIDPLVKSLRIAVSNRFRAQFKAIKKSGLDNWRAALHLRDKKLQDNFGATTRTAYRLGALFSQRQLLAAKEARRERAEFPILPGWTRSAGSLEDELDSTTLNELGPIIDQAYVGELTASMVMDLVRKKFKEWATGERAEMIALNEISMAYHGGMGDFVRDWRGGNGPVIKIWQTEDDPCPTCEANAGMGAIDSEAPFDSGDSEPPAHPNCRCSIAYEPDPTFVR